MKRFKRKASINVQMMLLLVLIMSILAFYLVYFSSLLEKEVVCDEPNRVRVFCMILTDPTRLETRAQGVAMTWAKECDNYKFITVIPEKYSNSAVRIDGSVEVNSSRNLRLLQPAGLTAESYTKLTDKVYLSIIDIYKRYKDFDWYLKGKLSLFYQKVIQFIKH